MHPELNRITVAAGLLACAMLSTPAFAEGRDAILIKRGALLVSVGDCVTCHTPFRMGTSGPEKDMAR